VLLAPGEFNGDGITDVFSNGGVCGFFKGSGDGTTFSDMHINPSWWEYVGEDQELVYLCDIFRPIDPLDFNGDGLTDFTFGHSNLNQQLLRYVFRMTGTDAQLMSGTLPLTATRYGDFNGDGLSDIFMNDASAYVELSDGQGGWTSW